MSEPVVRHFLVCRRVEYDLGDPLTPYSIRNVVFGLRPPDGSGFPFTVEEMWLFAHIDGDGEHEFWVDIIPTEDDGPDPVATYGPFLVRFGEDPSSVARGWMLRVVPFPQPGWYEFRLSCAGEILAREWIFLEDQ